MVGGVSETCQNCGVEAEAVLSYGIEHPVNPTGIALPAAETKLCYYCAHMDKGLLGNKLAAHISFCTMSLFHVLKDKE